jgi:nucleotide-binding universal stress UspA family protein
MLRTSCVVLGGELTMFQRILVPLDGSSLAEQAIPVAARLARASAGSLVLCRAVPELGGYAAGADALEAESYLTQMVQSPQLAGLTTQATAPGGPPAGAILQAVSDFGADTVIMNSHGRSGLSRWLLGSVAERVARSSPVPMLIVRGLDPIIWAQPSGGVERMLVGLDGSLRAEEVLAPALQTLGALVGSAPAQLTLVRVVTPAPAADDELIPLLGDAEHRRALQTQRKEAAETYLRAVARRVQNEPQVATHIQVTWSMVESDDAAAALIQAAAGQAPAPSTPTTVIALATHGRSGLQRWALGSVAERVLEGSHLPLLLVRPASLTGE